MSVKGPFRPPQIIRMADVGDSMRFLCLMEINLGEIAGGAFEIKPSEMKDSLTWARKIEDAWKHARVMIEDEEPWIKAGQDWEKFL